MVAFIIVAGFFTVVGFLLGFFLTRAAANKNQGEMKHCQSCQYFKSWQPFKITGDDIPISDFSGMSDEQYKDYTTKTQEEG